MMNAMKSTTQLALILFLPTFALARPWLEQVSADHPTALYRFEAGDPALKKVGEVKFVPGPQAEDSTTMPEVNRAAQFDGNGDYFIVPDTPELRFDNGDEITIEAWIKLDGIAANGYIIGKGRTSGKDNQNWALRLMPVSGSSRLSFLFRSRADGDTPEEFHRWNSSAGITPGKLWHHVAVSYRFGDPASVKGFINGVKTSGTWDIGKATKRAPVVDDAEIWIGSAQGGNPSNSFRGSIDEIAVYRKILPDAALQARVDFGPSAPAPAWDTLDPTRVTIDIHSGVSSDRNWPQRVRGEAKRIDTPAFALVDLPQVYTARGNRSRRTTEYLRMTAMAHLEAGEHQLLLRAPSLTRLWIDGTVVAEMPSYKVNGSAHGKMRPPADPEQIYPRARLGTRDTTFTFTSTGKPLQVMLEAVVGHGGLRFTIGELLVAHKSPKAANWTLLGPVEAASTPSFTPAGFEVYGQQQLADFTERSDQRRSAARATLAPEWEARHTAARNYVQTLPPIAIPELPVGFKARNPIDHFLAEKIHAAQKAEAGNDVAAALSRPAIALLEDQCIRCHGKKDKGELRLNTREAALAAGESGQHAIVPGSPEKSEVLLRMLSEDEDERMPPKGDRLNKAEIALIKDWIKQGAPWANRSQGVHVPPRLDETSFLRRLYLDTIGILPTPEEIRSHLADRSADKTERLIDQLLQHPRHADHWVGYWQDVLAENPRLVKGKLNNTGPFRWWLHEALLDKLPMDQFVYELVSFDGSTFEGGVAGFKIASENDAPMAAKAHVIATAFLGTEMKCARCHDAPYHSSTQEDLFSLAAMLEGKAITVPTSSTVPATFFTRLGGRKSLVAVTLNPGTPVNPAWPFDASASRVIPPPSQSKDRLAWEITRPENPRFAQALVNRLWKRYFGQGFVEPAGDWEGNAPSHPDLIDYLARELVAHNYSMEHLSRIILNSEAYRREARLKPALAESERFFEAPLKRRLSAEQLVDSLFAATGVPVYSEELTFDVPGAHTAEVFPTMGRPTRAWQFISLASDRDRPSLTLPYADSIVSLMKAFGWRSDRSEPVTEREDDANVLQPGMLANGIFGTWITRLSPYSDLTTHAVHAPSPEALTEDLYLRFLTRAPSDAERQSMLALLSPGFAERVVNPSSPDVKAVFVPAVREVSWENHLSAEANIFCAEIENAAELGPPASDRLNPEWRGRMEDALWALINAPEMQFVP
ncbi:MAG: mono/diheme cytochrome c family protein [Candidatus Omnitrophota bacterium]|jgi:mono/diheme cytochrome c family protein